MVTRGQLMTQADMDALATLADSIGAPMPTNFLQYLSYFDLDILPPTDVVGVVNYGAGGYTADEIPLLCHIYSYVTVAGRKHYSTRYAVGSVTIDNSASPYEVDWTWTAAVGVTGYVYVMLNNNHVDGADGRWSDVGGSTSFTDDLTSLNNPSTDFLTDQNPVESYALWSNGKRIILNGAPWTRELLRMRTEALANFTPDATWQVSGPWCVSVGPRLRYGADETNFGSVEFWFAADDHAGDLDFDTIVETGTIEAPLSLENTTAPGFTFTRNLGYTMPATGTATGRMTFFVAGTTWNTHVLSVGGGTPTIVSEVWTEDGDTLTLDYEFTLPAGAQTILVTVITTVAAFSSTAENHAAFYGDVLMDTEAITPTDADVIHPTSLGKKAVPTAVDGSLGLTFNGINFFTATPYYVVHHIADDTEGVWVAMTRPAFGVNTLLQAQLPNYASTRISKANDEVAYAADYSIQGAVTPAVSGRPALWPVYRDTEFGTWSPVTGKMIPYWPSGDPFHSLAQGSQSLEAGASGVLSSVFVASDYEKLIWRTSDPAMEIYVSTTTSAIDVDDPGTYDATATGEVRLPNDFAYAGGGTVWVAVKNPTAATVLFNLQRILCLKDEDGVYPGDEPVFFRKLRSGISAFEPYSFNIDGSSIKLLETPQAGYCVYDITIARAPVRGVVPSTGEAELDVLLGIMVGQTFDVDGVFTELDTMTIPADTASVRAEVFWPVLRGTPLAYQCSEAVNVMATVNFQPCLMVAYHPPVPATFPVQNAHGRWCGAPSEAMGPLAWGNDCVLFPVESILLPITKEIYNDTEALLTLL